MPTRLITIPFSHYCEKARWALDRARIDYVEHGHLPLFHYLATFRAGGKRTVPVVVDGNTVIPDSTEIIAWADARAPSSLLPADAAARAEALALEDLFDRDLGPATRRWGYYHLLPRRDATHIMARGVPRWEFGALRMTRPLAVGLLKRGLNITPEGVARSHNKIEDTFAHVADLLRDGRRYLAGETFSVADLTFASLAAPVLAPEQHPFAQPIDLFTGAAREQAETWRTSPAGAHALAMYRQHR